MILNDSQLAKLQKAKPPLIEDYIDWDKQLQPNGFDITVKEVHRLLGPGQVDFSNEERELPKTEAMGFKDGWLELPPGAYKIRTNEYVNIPNDVVAFAQTRSTLLRMGAFTVHAVWDAGFHGRSEFLLVVQNKHGIRLKKNARIAQLVFVRLGTKPDKVYFGVYKGMK